MKGRLKETSYPYMQSKVSGAAAKDPPRRAVVFVVGGCTFEEVGPKLYIYILHNITLYHIYYCTLYYIIVLYYVMLYYMAAAIEARDIAELNKSADGAFRHGAGDAFTVSRACSRLLEDRAGHP